MPRLGAFSLALRLGEGRAVQVQVQPEDPCEACAADDPRMAGDAPSAHSAHHASSAAPGCAASRRRPGFWSRSTEDYGSSGPSSVPRPALWPAVLAEAADIARVRWCVDATAWEPEGKEVGPEFQFLLSLISEESERRQVERFCFWKDKRRALLSRLLVRKVCAQTLGQKDFQHIAIARTFGRKPFLESPLPDGCPNFNFNCSHEGDFVVLASEPLCIVGVDVAAPRNRRSDLDGQVAASGSSFQKLRSAFRRQLTEREWEAVDSAGPMMAEKYDHFMRIWSCKEAVAKARGAGILGPQDAICGGQEGAMDIRRLEFAGFGPSGESCEPSLSIDGCAPTGAKAWRLHQEMLGGHWVTVARGPRSCVQDRHGRFLERLQKDFTEREWREALAAEQPPFRLLPVAALVPEDSREAYARAGLAGRHGGS